MKCMEIEPIEPVDYKDLTAIIYIAGYTISLLALSSSLAIFLRFRLVKSIYSNSRSIIGTWYILYLLNSSDIVVSLGRCNAYETRFTLICS